MLTFRQEGSTGEVVLPFEEAAEIGAVLQYCYCWEFDVPERENEALYISKVFVLADKYAIPDLECFCAKWFELIIKDLPLNAAFADIIRHVFETTPSTRRELRDHVISRVAWDFPAFRRCPELKQVMLDLAEVGSDVAMELSNMLRRITKLPDIDAFN